MECTKGEMKAGKINCGQFPISIDGRHFAMIKFTHLIDMKQDEANAVEFVRRWNAFEKDGLVDELLAACKEAQKAIFLLYECNKDVEIALGSGIQLKKAEKVIEAAIAKVI